MKAAADPVIEIAAAKVNLYLEVLGRRADGYHDLDSLVVFADVGERLNVFHADGLHLSVSGPTAAALEGEADNLVLRAAKLLQAQAGVVAGASIQLEKHIPVAAGVGGGSADAAAALRALNRLWNLRLDEDALCTLGARLGADVPVCVRSRPTRFTGTGLVLDEAPPLPSDLALVLVNPRVALATKTVFAGVVAHPAPLSDLPADLGDFDVFSSYLCGRRNDLMASAIKVAPTIGDCLSALAAAAPTGVTRMSGSGATCFALAADINAAAAIARRAATVNPSWWVWSGPAFRGAAISTAVA